MQANPRSSDATSGTVVTFRSPTPFSSQSGPQSSSSHMAGGGGGGSIGVGPSGGAAGGQATRFLASPSTADSHVGDRAGSLPQSLAGEYSAAVFSSLASKMASIDLGDGAGLQDVQELQRMLRVSSDRTTAFRQLLAGSAWRQRGTAATLRAWCFPVRFTDATTEAQFDHWVASGSSGSRQLSHLLLLFLLLIFFLSQVSSPYPITPFMIVAYIAIILLWAAGAVALCGPKWTARRVHLAALADTSLTLLIMISSLACSSWSKTVQCEFLEATHLFNGTHYIISFVMLLLMGIGFRLQAPYLFAHISAIYIVWFTMMLVNFPPTLTTAVSIPIAMFMLLSVVAAQAHGWHYETRLQFFLLMDLTAQLRLVRQAAVELKEAHETALIERGNAVRATTAREIHDGIMGYTCHQLRNPLHGLRGSLAELKFRCQEGHTIDKADTENLLQMELGVTQLAQVADDVLDFNRLQNGATALRLTTVTLSSMISDTVAWTTAGASRMVHVDIADDVPVAIFSDGQRLAQLLGIGLSNALKFGREGAPVKIACVTTRESVSDSGKLRPMLQFEVWNEGEGLGTLDVRRLFEPYDLRASGAIKQGFGLGLPLSRMIVSLFDGNIGLEDRDRYTVYWFRVPLQTSSDNLTRSPGAGVTRQGLLPPVGPSLEMLGDSSTNTASSFPGVVGELLPREDILTNERPWAYWGRGGPSLASQSKVHVLVVDDLQTNRRLLSAMLRKHGYTTSELEDGDQVFGALQDADRTVHVIMLDIHMVRTDGRQVTMFLREQGMSLPIIAVTGNVSVQDVQSYRASGFDGVLGKPFTSAHVADVFAAMRAAGQ